jgi:hypothetical protein
MKMKIVKDWKNLRNRNYYRNILKGFLSGNQ